MPELAPSQKRLISGIQNPLLRSLYFLKNIPSLLWWGLSVQRVTVIETEVTIPFNRRTQNPFNSMYFAAQSGASEFSTGILAALHSHGKGKISMLVTAMSAEYLKKATNKVTFKCTDGLEILEAIEKSISTGQPQMVKAKSVGTMPNGEIVAIMHFTWSFKSKTK